VLVEGRLQTRDYTDRDNVKRYVTEIVCEDLILLGGGDRGGRGPADDPGPNQDVPF